MEHALNETEPEPRTYVVDGEVWTVGAKKISMWSKSKYSKQVKKTNEANNNNKKKGISSTTVEDSPSSNAMT